MSDEDAYEPRVPWALRELIEQGAAPLDPRPQRGSDLDIVIVLEPGCESVGDVGLPDELVDALEHAGAEVTLLDWESAPDAADADLLLAGGWAAAAEVLRIEGVRARGVLAGAEPLQLPELHSLPSDFAVIAPSWLGGDISVGVDEAYRPLPSHRQSNQVQIHGQDALSLLAVSELAERRPDVHVIVSGMPFPASLPFEASAVDGGGPHIARSFALATVGVAPTLRGWRPVATAMMACGLPVVMPDSEQARTAFGEAALFFKSPAEGAGLILGLLDDLERRAELSRAGAEAVTDWNAVAREIVERFSDEGAPS